MSKSKKKRRPIWRKKRFYALIVLTGFLIFVYQFMQLRLPAEDFESFLQDAPFGYGLKAKSTDFINPDGQKIRYTEIGNDSLPLLVFLHGSPASSFIWKKFLKDSSLLQHAKLMAIDRPGYGYSGLGDHIPEVTKQVEGMVPLLRHKRAQHQVLVVLGASYGGTAAARLAMDYPHLVDGLILQSASTKPHAETIYSISYPTSHWSLRWLMPATIKMANEEKLTHADQLEAMQDQWQKIKAVTTILHGRKDQLIWPENALFSKKQLINSDSVSLHYFDNNGHDLIWTQFQALKKHIITTINTTKTNIAAKRKSES